MSGRAATPSENRPLAAKHQAGDLVATFELRDAGISLRSLADTGRGQELLATNSAPLFTLTLRDVATKAEHRVSADAGWRKVHSQSANGVLTLAWDEAAAPELAGLSVEATATAQPASHALHWNLQVRTTGTNLSVWRVVFPQLSVGDLGANGCVLFPRGPGEVQRGVWARTFKYHGNYPGGWCSMQFLAAYQEGEKPVGLYVGMHDPWGSTKDVRLESNPKDHAALLAFEHPAVDMGRGGNGFALSGQAVWQLLRGDWYDAAQIYRAWVRKEARWWPRLGPGGRTDTPEWMRKLNLWALGGGGAECVPGIRKFQRYFGDEAPIGFHWYNWHQIPFDNDYPHYFPAKSNFVAAVAELERANVHVMPYINGRLWDTRDGGSEDRQFTSVALPAASKQENGQPYVESYGSKETNGEPVRLAVMCPTTPLWQGKVSDTVLRLLGEMGTSSVYVDQVAAAPPTLCMDAAHGHLLGGGHWWNEGYWALFDKLRQDMPRGAALTTECNGEPFVRWFDGYLTWHWQHDGQVPAFPAIYGSAIQMFGRAYRGGGTKDLALRMKAGQQLVFGEQIGWLDPGVVDETENAEFLRRIVAVRSRFAEFFYAGEMARPPRFAADIPKVKADWQWSGEWWVTTDAVLAGAWRLPSSERLAVFFVNVSDQAVRIKPVIDAAIAQNNPAEWLRSDPDSAAALENRPTADWGAEFEVKPRQIQVVQW